MLDQEYIKSAIRVLFYLVLVILLFGPAEMWGQAQPRDVDLAWDHDDPLGQQVIEYRIYRSSSPGGPYIQIGSIQDPTPGDATPPVQAYSDIGVVGKAYYVVSAVDSDGLESGYSNEVGIPPTAPYNVIITIVISIP